MKKIFSIVLLLLLGHGSALAQYGGYPVILGYNSANSTTVAGYGTITITSGSETFTSGNLTLSSGNLTLGAGEITTSNAGLPFFAISSATNTATGKFENTQSSYAGFITFADNTNTTQLSIGIGNSGFSGGQASHPFIQLPNQDLVVVSSTNAVLDTYSHATGAFICGGTITATGAISTSGTITSTGTITSAAGNLVTTTGSFNSGATQTTTNGSSAGTVTFSMPFAGASLKRVFCILNGFNGSVTITSPTNFTSTNTMAPSGPLSADVTIVGTNSFTITTATPTSGEADVEGY